MTDARSATLSGWEPVEAVRARARRSGRRLSDKQLHTAQQRGAIPAPTQVHLGRRGSRTLYPPGTTQQLARYCTLLDDGLSIESAVWRLWCEGWPIEDAFVRKRLVQDIGVLQNAGKWHAVLSTSDAAARSAAQEQLLDWSLKRTRLPGLRAIFSLAGSALPDLIKHIAAETTGEFTRLSTSDAGVLASVLGATIVTRAETVGTGALGISEKMVRQASSVLAEVSQTDVAMLSSDELRAARDESRLLWALLPAFTATVARPLYPAATQLLHNVLAEGEELQPTLVLTWLYARRHEAVSAWFAHLVAPIEAAKAAALDLSAFFSAIGLRSDGGVYE